MCDTLLERLLGTCCDTEADLEDGDDLGGTGKDAEREGPERCGCGGSWEAVMGEVGSLSRVSRGALDEGMGVYAG